MTLIRETRLAESALPHSRFAHDNRASIASACAESIIHASGGNALSLGASMVHRLPVYAIEPLECRRLFGAEWTASFRGNLPEAVPPGGTILVTVIAKESSGIGSADTVGATLYASSEPSLSSDATQLAQTARRLASGRAVRGCV